MEIQGKVIQILQEVKGQGKAGEWRKQEYVIETGGNYPKKLCFSLWGDKIDTFSIKMDESIKVEFDVESREYNGRWYTDVRAWRVSRDGADNSEQFPPSEPIELLPDDDPSGGLPF